MLFKKGALRVPELMAGVSVAALAVVALGPAAQAQVADASGSLEEVVVTGFRGSLNAAIDAKRNSADVVDVIKAEDIADFPDNNLAESIQRVPGVTIARDAGEGRQISVRGLSSDFTRVRINGMEALTTTGGTDSSGGTNRGRGFDFNVFASELFNSITVRKTASAEVEEGSLGATVDLQAARPFDYDDMTFVVSGQGGYNDLSEKVDPRGAVLVSNTWADGTFGALFSAAYTKRRILEEGHSTGRWDNGTSNGGFNAASSPTGISTTDLRSAFHPRLPRYGRLTHEQERLGLTGALQWQPAERTLFNLDVMYAKMDSTRQEDFLEAISFSRPASQGGKPQTIVKAGERDSRNNLVYGVFDDVDIRSESRYDEMTTEYTQYVLSGEHEFSDSFKVRALAGYAKSDYSNPIQTTVTIDRLNSDNYSWDYRGDDRLPQLSYGYDVTNPANYTFGSGSEIRLRPQWVENTVKTGTLDADYEVNEMFTLSSGLSWKTYKFDSRALRRQSETTVPGLPAGTTLADLTTLVDGFGKNLDVPGGTPTRWVIPDIDAFNRLLGIYSNTGTFALVQNSSALGDTRSVEEEDQGAYVQGNFELELFGRPFHGNAGVRYVKTKQTSTGYQFVGSTPVQVTADRSYDDWLPSVNLVLDVTDDILVRAGWAKVMARPGLGSVTPGGSVNISGAQRSVTSGNPEIEPFRATTYDLGFEWYFAKESLLSIGLFYKDIDTFVQSLSESRPFTTSGLPLSLLDGTGLTGSEDFVFTRPVNTEGGPLKGVEISFQTPFSFLPEPFSNFGTILNYTYVDSEIDYLRGSSSTATVTQTLTGLSKHAYNATLYYEDDAFSARVSAAYRDDYLTRVPGQNNNDVEGTKGTLSIDMSTSYRITEQLKVTLEALNLTDEFNDQYVDTAGDRVYVYHHTGRQFYLGFQYTY
ncbi:TonB-dependent receptor [Oleisolibacter albus]|uniref:TonB-dependent receptor n=1 Tax=Oleisolibacter albus TaxID=2171757 RepID=UPI0019616C68|nr:TonB-dependent receptor [Oleisolibacter albus]